MPAGEVADLLENLQRINQMLSGAMRDDSVGHVTYGLMQQARDEAWLAHHRLTRYALTDLVLA